MMTTQGYIVESNFIKRGAYKRTEIDEYKDSVDFLITACYRRYEIVFNKPTELKAGRGIEAIGDSNGRAYLVTEKALNALKEKYTWATDF